MLKRFVHFRGISGALKRFVRFGGLSGAGWLLDFCILVGLIKLFHLTPFHANLISATCAATLVFCVARAAIFSKIEGHFTVRLTVYILYSLMVIIAASALVQGVDMILAKALALVHKTVHEEWRAAAAKILITPATLALNFIVACRLIERRIEQWM